MKHRTFGPIVLVAALVVVLAVVAAVSVRKAADGTTATAASTRGGASTEGGVGAAQSSSLLKVKLEELTPPRPEPMEGGRNPFELHSKVEPTVVRAPEHAGAAPVTAAVQPTAGEAGPQTVPPIPLKFIGVVNAPNSAGRLAVLTDGRAVFQGREGDIVEGRYRILRIGVESVELEHMDGRGRQTIRLSG